MRELLALPMLLPLAVALVVGLFNLSTPSRLKFLLWSSPTLPLGSWVMLAAGGGAAIGAAFSAASVLPRRRRLEAQNQTESKANFKTQFQSEPAQQKRTSQSQAWPEQDPQAPAPTVSVPFKVVSRKQAPVSAQNPGDWDESIEADW